MLRAYQGYFDNGHFISLDNVPIPEKKRVIITVLEDEHRDINMHLQKSISEQQLLAFEKYFKAIDAIEGEHLTEADFAELENNRLNFRREIDL